MYYYSFNIGDYTKDTTHLTDLEDLAYRRMMDLYYSRELPLPQDHKEICRLVRMRSHCDCIATVLQDFFTLEDDGYHQLRIDAEINAYKEKSDKAKASAKARWKKVKADQKVSKVCERIANAQETQCEGNAKQEPINKNQEPINNNITSTDVDEIDSCFERFWFSGIKKVNKKKAKLSFVKIIKREKDRLIFTLKLIEDVKTRIQLNQLGFSEMHPTTYLNGERWNDDYPKEHKHNNQERLSTVEQSLRVGAEYKSRLEMEREARRRDDQSLGYANS